MPRTSTSTASNIKNLTIALEALSRFPNPERFTESIDSLLLKEIDLMREEQYPPVISTTHQAKTEDDDIPF